MNSLVTASQSASDGTVTATLILNDRYINSLPQSIFNTPQEQQQLDSGLSTYTVAVTFNSADAVDALCSGSATVGSSLVETCPLELGGVARRCVSVSCQSIPGKMVAANVKASFSVCPSGLASGCGLSDTAVGNVLGRIAVTRTTSTAVTSSSVKSKSIVTNEGESKANAQREGANNAVPMSTSTSTLATGMAAPAVAAPAAKGAEPGVNLVVIIVPILVVLLAVAAGVYIYMRRRGSSAADADAEERGKISAVAKRKGSTDKEAITETTATVAVSQEETTQTSTPSTTTTTPSIAETPKSKKQAKNGAKAKPAVSTKPPNIDEPRVQTLAPGQVRYINVRGSPAPIPIPAPPASLGGTSMRSPTSTIGSASIFNIPAVPAQSFGYIYQGYTPNPNLPNQSVLPGPGIPARANPYPGYYDQQGNYHFY
ncbi:hypothetical protein HDU78_007448 [Chytriomyces hyalinus]|nr:hypothetical protein HDU78_007448 [Chytriomyces hyalinus]